MAMENTGGIELGSELPTFLLPDPTGVLLDPFSGAEGDPFLVMFLCNHCPFVRHIASRLGELGASWTARGLRIIAINSNDWTDHPSDAPERMPVFAAEHGWGFPYLVDEEQEVARTYGAACTPDLYLSDRDHRLAYHGQFDDTRPGGSSPATGADLAEAVELVLAGRTVPSEQRPSIGCSIKWKPGHGV